MVAAVNGTPRGPVPDVETVERLLGPIKAQSARPAEAGGEREGRRRRRA
jgi:5-methyltetrahydrofolate--homocysteine methyltransferase